jgi:hypothetical protein
MTKRTPKSEKPLDAQDGPDEPIDWSTRDPFLVTKDEVIEHLIRFGKDSVPSRLAHEVLSRDDDDRPEPAKMPYIDVSTMDPTLFSVDNVLEHIATHGLHSMSMGFIEAVMKRTYRDCEDDGLEDMSPGFLVSLALEAGKKANALNYVINMYSLTLDSDLDKEAIGELCDQIERHLGDVVENVTELDRRLNLVEA